MSDIRDWHVTAAENNDPPPDGAPENMAAQTFNNVLREVMAAVARWWYMTRGIPSTQWEMGGGAPNYRVRVPETFNNYYTGLSFRCRMHAANDGSVTPTLRVEGHGRVPIRYSHGDDSNPRFAAGEIVELIYDNDPDTPIFRWLQASVSQTVVDTITFYNSQTNRFQNASGQLVHIRPGSLVFLPQSVYDAAAADNYDFPDDVVFLTSGKSATPGTGDPLTTYTLGVAKATSAGVGVDVSFPSVTGDFLVVVEADEAAPRIKLTAPAGRVITGIYDQGADVTSDFDRVGSTPVWLSNVDYDGGAIMLLVRTAEV